MRSRDRVVDEMLVLAAQAGRAEAFERLARRWHPRLLRHARRLTGDAEAANDVVQEAWVAIAGGLLRLHDPASFGPWALCITGRRCADWIASRRRRRPRTAGLDEASHAVAADRSPDEARARVREVLRLLEPERRALVAMYYVDGMTVGEIAVALDIPDGTVKSRLAAARNRLRAALEV
jgi:RNA polymerase sigma-70 factor (ECF subfamily)